MRTKLQLRALRRSGPLVVATLAALGAAALLPAAHSAAPAAAQSTADCSQASPPPQPATPAGYAIINFTNACGQQVPLAVDVAINSAEWQSGLMNLASLPASQGELFDFAPADNGQPISVSFWNHDVYFPLSVAFVGSDGTIEQVLDMAAMSDASITPSSPFLYAVEANQGWFTQNNIQPGSTVDLSAALALAGATPTPTPASASPSTP